MQPKPDIGKSLTVGWNLFKEEWQTWVVTALLVMTINGIAMLLLFIPFIFVAGPLHAGCVYMALKQLRGEKIQVSDVWWGFSRYGDTVILGLMIGLIVFGGMLLCFVPAFIFGAWYKFAFPLLVDRGLSWSDAMAESKKMTGENLMDFVVFNVVSNMVSSLGSYICYVGVLASLPVYYLMVGSAYGDLFGRSDAPAAE